MENTTVNAVNATAAGALVGHSTRSLTVNDVSSSVASDGSPSNNSVTAANYVGGLIGRADEFVSVNASFADASVTASLPDGALPTAANYAGGLIGYAQGSVTVENSASYSSDLARPDHGGRPASVTATGDNGVAGGLIGAIQTGAGKSSSVTNCAAANQVTTRADKDGVAGGLIGQTDGTVNVKLSYAGGVTADGGNYNHSRVAGTDDTLKGNAQGAYAGGLIGKANSGTVTLEKVYSAASAYGRIAAGSLYTDSGAGRIQKASADDPSYGAGEYQKGTDPATDPIKKIAPDVLDNPMTGAKPYDQNLLDGERPDATAYPYMGLQDMDPSLQNSKYEWMKSHVGDWPKVEPLNPKIVLHNEEILYADVFLDDCDYSSAELEIKGPNGTSVTIHFPLNPETGEFDENLTFDPETGELKSCLILDPETGEWKRDPSAPPQRVFPKGDSGQKG